MYKVAREKNIQKILLPQYFWYGRKPLSLSFPANWKILICEMEGDSRVPLTTSKIKEKINSPIGTKNIEELAKGKKEAAIVVDDITRPTEAVLIIQNVLESLYKAGIKDDSIRFLLSLGSHGAHNNEDFRKKLGNEVVERFGVYNHNCYENCIDVGKTKSGLSLKINEELMKCDLKIGIGAILPHLYVGYSGGGKLFLPGMAHIDTIDSFHSFLSPSERGKIDFNNPMYREIEDAVSLIEADYKIDVLVNTRGEIIDLFAGHPISEYKEGIKVAEKIYKTKIYDGLDIVISNAHLKVNEGDIALLLGLRAVKEDDGTCVLIMNSPSGQITHYLMRRFGKFIGGRQAVSRAKIPEKVNVIVYSQYKDMTTFDPYENQEKIIWEKDWSRIINRLIQYYGETDVKVGIIPDGTVQYL